MLPAETSANLDSKINKVMFNEYGLSKCSDYAYTWIANMSVGISIWDDGVVGFHHN